MLKIYTALILYVYNCIYQYTYTVLNVCIYMYIAMITDTR